ncbi:hypothetical protein PP348_20245 [Mycobacteroides abscessus]|nr:hypothetical protein [Mycobacteroides abscessus]MDM2203059.1 hypothetical protein [Mycobacteroides abscessus]
MLNGWLSGLDLGAWSWMHALPLGELGGTLFGAGLLGTLFEYSFRKDQEEATVEQFRQIIREQAPALRDAVIEGFAIHPDDLKRVANPDLRDDIVSNVMSLRLGDEQFAHEIYRDIRDFGSMDRPARYPSGGRTSGHPTPLRRGRSPGWVDRWPSTAASNT